MWIFACATISFSYRLRNDRQDAKLIEGLLTRWSLVHSRDLLSYDQLGNDHNKWLKAARSVPLSFICPRPFAASNYVVTLEPNFRSGQAPSLSELAISTEQRLWEIKLTHRPKSFWYPYRTLWNVGLLERLSADAGLDLLQLCRGQYGKVADIGAADGDLAFFLENRGLLVDAIDNESTNFNRFQGVRILKDALNSSVTLRSVDLDSQFNLPSKKYDAIFLLGTIYHLKNPFFVLEKLAQMTRYCFASTRIAKQTADGHLLSPYPVAYLLGPRECNDDDTNYWIFTDEGLKRLIDRTGWSLLSQINIGDTTSSTPADLDRDERTLVLLRRADPTLSASPNPIPAGDNPGRTTISWSGGAVYVSMNDGKEVLFADLRQGSKVASWILTGSSYEFRLYDSDHTELLVKLAVTKGTQ
jgi:tRNA (mo5U34)-methyltransferase